MSTTKTTEKSTPARQDTRLLQRILDEGHGPGAWHGNDFKAALADVETDRAFWRPAEGRHNIAEIALHHAYCVRNVRGQISGETPESFVLAGDDWFEASDGKKLSWAKIRATVEAEQDKLVAAVNNAKSDLTPDDALKLALGITCHANYHAGQVQLIKRLHDG